jgi:hypothetical protein
VELAAQKLEVMVLSTWSFGYQKGFQVKMLQSNINYLYGTAQPGYDDGLMSA